MNTLLVIAALSLTKWPELPPVWPTVPVATSKESLQVQPDDVYPTARSLAAPVPDSLRTLPAFEVAAVPDSEEDCPPGET